MGELARLASRGVPIVVEGRSDEEVLRVLGAKTVIRCSEIGIKKSLEVLEQFDEVLILTDFDEEGEKLCLGLRRGLVSNGVRTLDDLRDRLRRAFSQFSLSVEGLGEALSSLLERRVSDRLRG